MFGLFKKKEQKTIFDLTPEQDTFLFEASEYHNKNILNLQENWGFSDYEEWGFSQDTGIFFLKLKDGSRIEANGQIYGSYSTHDTSWEWAWNNPHSEENIAMDSLKAKEYGKETGLNYLTVGIVEVYDILYATYLASIAEKLNNAQGVFPGNAGEVIVFIGLKNLKKV